MHKETDGFVEGTSKIRDFWDWLNRSQQETPTLQRLWNILLNIAESEPYKTERGAAIGAKHSDRVSAVKQMWEMYTFVVGRSGRG